jgi:CDP-diglyceride synthetase
VLRARLLTAAVAIPLLVWAIFWGPLWLFNFIVLGITFIALREFSAMALEGLPHATTMVTVGGMTIALATGLGQSPTAVSAGIVVCLAGVLIGTLATARPTKGDRTVPGGPLAQRGMEMRVQMAGQILLGCLYAGLLLPHFIWVRVLPGTGPAWVFFVLACVMAGDAGGYFGGKSFGKRKLWPQVSPNKTVEGALSSFLASVVVGAGADVLVLKTLGPLEVIAVAGTVNVLAQLGDLLESMLKRAYDAQDSGWIFPGHGGVLDRTDSLVLPIVFVYYYAILSHGYGPVP